MRRYIAGIIGVVALGSLVGWSSIRPSHERAWLTEQRLLPYADIDGDMVTIGNIRDFRWDSAGPVHEAWDTRRYEVSQLQSVSYVLTPFSQDWRGPAHAFLSFGFRDGRYLTVSVEARREQGETYSMVRGALKRFELMYVIADERDAIHLRVARGDDVYVYPVRASHEQIAALFLDIIARINVIRAEPEFYGTLLNNCTTNILDHVNTVASRKIRYGRKILLPGYSDQLAYERGLIDTDLTLEQARARFRINDRVPADASGEDFSARIRAQH
jgi:hypothetical protein